MSAGVTHFILRSLLVTIIEPRPTVSVPRKRLCLAANLCQRVARDHASWAKPREGSIGKFEIGRVISAPIRSEPLYAIGREPQGSAWNNGESLSVMVNLHLCRAWVGTEIGNRGPKKRRQLGGLVLTCE